MKVKVQIFMYDLGVEDHPIIDVEPVMFFQELSKLDKGKIEDGLPVFAINNPQNYKEYGAEDTYYLLNEKAIKMLAFIYQNMPFEEVVEEEEEVKEIDSLL